MTKKEEIRIPKSTLERIIELFLALRIIHDSSVLAYEGKSYHITTIYGQLRAILTDNTQQKYHDKSPILIQLAEELDIDLNFFINGIYFDDFDILKETRDSIMFGFATPDFSLNKQNEAHREISVRDFLNLEILWIKKTPHTMGNIINCISNSFGGSHYDPTTPMEVVDLTQIKWGDIALVDIYLMDFTRILLPLGIRIHQSISDLDIVFGFKVSMEAKEDYFLFDFGLWKFNVSLKMKGSNLYLMLSDLIGFEVQIEIEQHIRLDFDYVIRMAHKLEDDYSSTIRIYMNNSKVAEEKYPPLLLFNSSREKFYFNTSKTLQTQDFGFSMFAFVARSSVLTESQRTAEFDFFEQEYFGQNNYPYIEPYTYEIQQ